MGLLSTPRSRWVALAAVVALVAAAHVVQPLLLPWRTKFYLAIPGTFLYVATAWAALGCSSAVGGCADRFAAWSARLKNPSREQARSGGRGGRLSRMLQVLV